MFILSVLKSYNLSCMAGKDTVQPCVVLQAQCLLNQKILFEQTINGYTLGILPTKGHGVLVKLCLISSELTILTKDPVLQYG